MDRYTHGRVPILTSIHPGRIRARGLLSSTHFVIVCGLLLTETGRLYLLSNVQLDGSSTRRGSPSEVLFRLVRKKEKIMISYLLLRQDLSPRRKEFVHTLLLLHLPLEIPRPFHRQLYVYRDIYYCKYVKYIECKNFTLWFGKDISK